MNAHTLTGAGGIAAGGVAGIFGDATDFDGTDDVITTDADGSFGTDGFTMMFWLNLDAVGWQGAMGDDTDDHIMRPRNTNLMNFQSLGAGSRRNLESASTITLSAWEHWAGSRGAAGGALYRDGSLDQSDAHVANAATAADPLVLGRKGTDEINGQMQEFQYHLTQRSADWIAYEQAMTADNATQMGTWTEGAISPPSTSNSGLRNLSRVRSGLRLRS